MSQPLINAGPVATFPESNPTNLSPGPLSNLENLLVDLDNNGAARLLTQPYATGVLVEKLNPLDNSVAVALTTSGAIAKVIQSAPIPINSPVQGVTTVGPTQGQVAVAPAGSVACGVKVGPNNGGAAGDLAYVMLAAFKA